MKVSETYGRMAVQYDVGQAMWLKGKLSLCLTK
jgi:hypothetical protein